MLKGIRGVLARAGATIKPELVSGVGSTVVELLNESTEAARTAACEVFGVYCTLTTEEELWNLLNSVILVDAPTSDARHGQMGALKGIAENANERPAVEDRREDILAHVASYCELQGQPEQVKALEAAGALVANAIEGDSIRRGLLELMVKTGESAKQDSKVAAMEQIKLAAKKNHASLAGDLDAIVPWLVTCRASKNFAINHAATRALVHVLAIHTDPSVVAGYEGAEVDAVRGMVKSLTKQDADSDTDRGTGADSHFTTWNERS